MVPSETPSAPMYADTDPPPGAGDSEAVSFANPLQVKSISFFSLLSSRRNSMILSLGSKGLRSSRPRDFTAILRISSSEIPTERF